MLRLIRNEAHWSLPDAEVADLFLVSRFAEQNSGRGNRIVTQLGEFVGSESFRGGLQSVLLLDEEAGRSIEQVIAAVMAARPDRVDWIEPPTKRSRSAARAAHRTALRIMTEDRDRAQWVRRVVDAAPPISETRMVMLRDLLRPSREDLERQIAERKHFKQAVCRGEGDLLGGSGQVRLWWDRRLDRGWALSERDLVDRFLSSRFADPDSAEDQHEALCRFVTAKEYDGGLQSAWVIDADPATKAAHRQVLALLEPQFDSS